MPAASPGSQRRSARPALPPIRLTHSCKQAIESLENQILRMRQDQPLRILEAGCGNKWPLKLEGRPYQLTAVDIDRDALEIRKTRVRDVDEVMVGDLRTSDLFRAKSLHVIYNSFVLEHVDGAEQVLDNFLRWLAPGGMLILRIPDRDSVYGFLTRSSPFWMHVLYKKYVQGIKNAGKPLVRAFARAVVPSISALSFGRLDWRYNNLTFVIEK